MQQQSDDSAIVLAPYHFSSSVGFNSKHIKYDDNKHHDATTMHLQQQTKTIASDHRLQTK
jgi:hypothetical protein